MKHPARGTLSHIAYVAAIAIKGFDGALELVLGCLIAVAGSSRIYYFVFRITAPELDVHPHNHAAHLARSSASALAGAPSHFVLTYLFIHGGLKFILAVCLLRERGRWIFPVASLILTGFIVYMGHRLTERWSNWLLGFALFDLLTLALVLNEWRKPTVT